ncbi:MAG: hypothetical protein ACREAC_19805 [Blastocatellia bacterium]
MLTIELRRSDGHVCSECNDGGVKLPGLRKLLTDDGSFCECRAGSARWEAMNKIAIGLEKTLTGMPSFTLPPLPLPAPRRFYY